MNVAQPLTLEIPRMSATATSGEAAADPQGWRADVLATMVRVVFVLGSITAVPSIYLSVEVGLPVIAIFDLIAVAWAAILVFRSDIPYRLRAANLVALIYLLGAILLAAIGTTGPIYLMAVPVLTALLIGLRPALAALVLTSLTVFLVGSVSQAGRPGASVDPSPFLQWAVIALNFAFVCAIITIATAVLLGRLERSITHASRLARAVEQSREGIVIGDETGQITYANAAFEAMVGLTGDVLPGRPLTDIPLGTTEGMSLIEAIEQAGNRPDRLILTRIDEPTVHLEALSTPLADSDGRVRDRVIVLRDLTSERQMEARLRQSERLEALGTLAGGVAHDFNNIIGSILAVTEASRYSTPDGELRENFDRVIVACDRARAIVGRMLAFSGRSEPERRSILVSAIVDETVPLLRAALPSSIDLRVTAATDAIVVADPSELQQILMNLATNAAHAMSGKGGGRLDIEVTPFLPDEPFAILHPAVRAAVPYVLLSVTDTGGGIERAVIDRIFEPFFTTKSVHEGTGLGLATVHGIVTSLGGAIDVYSEVGHGATFRIYLPRAEAATSVARAIEPTAAAGGTGHILLVDDEEAIRTMTDRMLVGMGYEVTTAPDGLAARQIFAADPAAFDIVVADLTMPGLGGAGLIRAIHALRPDLPAILTSGFSDSMAPEERAGLDLASFLQKPYTRAELAGQVHDALEHVPTGPPVGAAGRL